ncbi:uncharacterized protein L3040_007567 [Drepanopeziza brunnea f. sp. 'multigermtubi']|uniref:COM1 regulatory protein n=1 Tax=Marssonina brunnea f. sp. multigermtubi (strain MB_m1) TaxID=1072389 RepID=K1X0A2_MARBU|nr:COM1 regulatory protein [Drepanopeziza brunnea f. sp. 'multigermtubi' MB_m1]EKD18407.1 COM1 regulatory protein [Drepanopeziza brunnea f. sp. 'multigermtubi' MB_m1]KAJ5037391.1 hypothetical protein L3040_007567 [Drepanopeziza brunnea f. sp. 'multigermtubi']
MPSLHIPESGLSLGSSPGASSGKAGGPDVLGLSLTDSIIEEMIKCVQNGKEIQLSLGEHPSLLYGTKSHHLVASHDPFTHELYHTTNSSQSDPDSSDDDDEMYGTVNGIKLQRAPNIEFLASMGFKLDVTKTAPKPASKPAAAPASKSTTTTDAALAQLTGALASEQQKKHDNTTKVIDSLMVPGRKGGSTQKITNKSKFLNQQRSLATSATRSLPTSPSLNSAGSPSLGPASVPLSQQNAEKSKEARKPVIHLLAVEPLTEMSLRAKLPDLSETELKNALQKVGDLNETTSKWELRKGYWKELDVWTFRYSGDERQRAIDNAVKQFDKMRMGVSEPEWERLLAKSERGTGKCLSKLQADIAARNLARTSKAGDASGKDTPNGADDDVLDDKQLSKVKGDGSARSSSQPPSSKPKKPSEKEAQAKRLFSNKPSKAAAKPAPKAEPKAAASKATSNAPAKSAPKATKKAAAPKAGTKAGTKALSAEYVEDSDNDSPPRPAPPTSKAAPKPRPAVKRPREEDERATSDSSLPLSKKVKKDVPAASYRVSDASHTSRATTNSSNSSYTSTKHKSNSPPKSSPLASSPPTNASDMDSAGDRTSSSASPAPRISTKDSRSPIYKRHGKSSSVTSSSSSGTARVKPEAINLAAKYKLFYPRYVELFEEVLAEGDNRTRSKERDLLDMHERLEDMRRQIIAIVHEN